MGLDYGSYNTQNLKIKILNNFDNDNKKIKYI